jgi:hypothetical protein
LPTSQIESSHEPEISPQRYIDGITLHPDVGGVTPDNAGADYWEGIAAGLPGYGLAFCLPFQFGFGLIVN